MVRVFALAACAAISTFLAQCQTPVLHPSIGVFLDFDSAPGKLSLEVMKKEVAALLKPSGVSLDWRLAKKNHGDESFAGLVVLKFKGKCKVESWNSAAVPGQTTTLGTTAVSDGHILPFSEVKCDALKEALSYLRPDANQGERQNAFGLAMGRVVAHEIYHVLARTGAHAARGLAKAAESLEDLVSIQGMPFRAEDNERIQRALLH
jgi:hypothetical protein